MSGAEIPTPWRRVAEYDSGDGLHSATVETRWCAHLERTRAEPGVPPRLFANAYRAVRVVFGGPLGPTTVIEVDDQATGDEVDELRFMLRWASEKLRHLPTSVDHPLHAGRDSGGDDL